MQYKEAYENLINIPNIKCPDCDCESLTNHHKYTRSFIFLVNDTRIEETIEIKRVRCTSCKKTHALIPELIVPYKQHTLTYIVTVIVALKTNSKKRIASNLNVTRSLIYYWYYIYLEQHKAKMETLKLKVEHFITNYFETDLLYLISYKTRFLSSIRKHNCAFT